MNGTHMQLTPVTWLAASPGCLQVCLPPECHCISTLMLPTPYPPPQQEETQRERAGGVWKLVTEGNCEFGEHPKEQNTQ